MPEYQAGFGFVYQWVMRNRSLSAEAKTIYAYLCCFAGSSGTCYPGLELMLVELGMSKTRFYKHLAALIDAGIVSKHQERNGQRLGRTIYTLNHAAAPLVPHSEDTQNEESENCEIPCSEDTHFEESQSEEHKSNSLKSNSFNNNRNICDAEFVERVCKLLNEGKRKASSKGRLKAAAAMFLDDLIREGLTKAQIIAAAKEVAHRGKDVDWLSFYDYCHKR